LLKWWAGSSDDDIDEPRAIDVGIVGMRGHMDMAVIAAVGYTWGK